MGVAKLLAMKVPTAKIKENATIAARRNKDSRGGGCLRRGERRASKPNTIPFYLNPQRI